VSAPREPAIELLDHIVTGLRARARRIRTQAIADGVVVRDHPYAIVRTSESVQRLRIAADLETLATDLETGAGR
jgi:hypothetical protein